MRTALIAIAFVSGAALSTPSIAAVPAQTWDQIMKAHGHVKEAGMLLDKAEQAPHGERHRLMGEHRQAMEKAMHQMKSMKPMKDMSMEEHERWIHEHQTFMDEVMAQMMREHKMMMDGCPRMKAESDHKDDHHGTE